MILLFSIISGAFYKCTGDISEWSHCTHQTKTPERVLFKIDKDTKNDCPYLFVCYIIIF